MSDAEMTVSPPAPTIEWKLQTGFDFSTGDYDLDRDTQLVYVPFTLQATSDRVRVRLTLPLLYLDGPTEIIAGGTIGAAPDQLVSSDHFGLGQIVTSASYLFGQQESAWPYVEVTARVTAPTETDGALGSGLWAGAVQLDLFDQYGAITPFASLGRKFYEGSRLDDRFYASAGFSVRATEALSVGLAYDWLEATIGRAPDVHQLSPFASLRLDDRWTLAPYAVFGLSNGAPDYGAGLTLGVRL